ncbi:MAG TPA: hypothetical protein VI566_08260 [Xanthomonadales bacterium]|nr:hypothetical protein [Xanthomonadales bacterium]
MGAITQRSNKLTCRLSMLVLVVLVTLVLGQFALAVHETDQRQHAPGGHCEWCIAATPLHAALGASALALPPASACHVYAAHLPRASRSFHTSVYLGRAPPLSSFC